MPNLIGLMGQKGSGKDTVGKMICCTMNPSDDMDDIEDQRYIRAAFADALKEVAITLDPIIECDARVVKEKLPALSRVIALAQSFVHPPRTYGRLSTILSHVTMDEAKQLPDVRQFLQRLGTEAGRDILGPNIWVETLDRNVIAPALENGISVVITDVRFPNEIEYVRSHEGQLWRVDRPGLDDSDPHPSEHAWRSTEPDTIIWNNGSLENLESVVRAICFMYLRRPWPYTK